MATNCTGTCFKTGVFTDRSPLLPRFCPERSAPAEGSLQPRALPAPGSRVPAAREAELSAHGVRPQEKVSESARSLEFRLALQCKHREFRAIVEKIRPRKIHASS